VGSERAGTGVAAIGGAYASADMAGESARSRACRGSEFVENSALEDAQKTVGLVRFHAAEWHIDPHKIGVLGLSAGGHLSAAMGRYFAKRLYPLIDAADKESCRPDFAGFCIRAICQSRRPNGMPSKAPKSL
jgi:dienelactone hydrolase